MSLYASKSSLRAFHVKKWTTSTKTEERDRDSWSTCECLIHFSTTTRDALWVTPVFQHGASHTRSLRDLNPETQLWCVPGSPQSNKQHLKHIWRGKAQTASLTPTSWLGGKRKPGASQGCDNGGEEPNTHNLMSQLKQSTRFIRNAKAGKSFGLMHTATHCICSATWLYLQKASNSNFYSGIAWNFFVHPSPPVNEGDDPPPEEGSFSLGVANMPGERRRKPGPWARVCCATLCTGSTIPAWPQQSHLFMGRNKSLGFPYLSLKLQGFY